MRLTRLLLAIAVAGSAAGAAVAEVVRPPPDCAAAAEAAEHAWQLPEQQLLAIGLAESGQRDGATARLRPMPYSVNFAGADVVFASADYAVAAVAALRGRGIGSIDVGCFQVNLRYHPGAFASLTEAFDPTANAFYAGGFLRRLFAQTGNWGAAVAAYHSADPARGSPYRDRVLRFWQALQADRPARIAGASDPHVIRIGAAASIPVSSIPVYSAATLPAALRARLSTLIQP